ncbi:MAG: OsmC family peroxiredoxin, partial [Saprospiraceae bacterium]
IAAAHAGCFSMKLSFILNAAGFTPDNIDTKCTITLEGGAITESHLDVKAIVPGIDDAKFVECAEEARQKCPVSKVLNTNITMNASLDSPHL